MTAAENAPSQAGSPLWRFSLRFYRQPHVADACIALQESSAADVNLLLLLLWLATRRRALSRVEIEGLERRIAPWREMTVRPLRAVRRALKSPPELVAGNTAESFRTRIKAVELEAERLQQEAMYELARTTPLGTETSSMQMAARANVAAYELICAGAFSAPTVEILLAALDVLERQPEE